MIYFLKDFPDGTNGKKKKTTCLPMQETQKMEFRSLDQENPLEKEMATHSSICVWEIPWTEQRGRLQSMGSQRVGLCAHLVQVVKEIKGQ